MPAVYRYQIELLITAETGLAVAWTSYQHAYSVLDAVTQAGLIAQAQHDNVKSIKILRCGPPDDACDSPALDLLSVLNFTESTK